MQRPSEKGGLSGGLRVGAEFGDQSGPGPAPALCRAPVPASQRGSCPFPRVLVLGRAVVAGCAVGHSPLGPHGSWPEAQVLGQEHGDPFPTGPPRWPPHFAWGVFPCTLRSPGPLPPEPPLSPEVHAGGRGLMACTVLRSAQASVPSS